MVQPAGTVSVCGVDSVPPPSSAGTMRVVGRVPAAGATGDAPGDPDNPENADPGAEPSWPSDPVHAAAAVTTAAATSASGKRLKGSVMEPPPVRPSRIGTPTSEVVNATIPEALRHGPAVFSRAHSATGVRAWNAFHKRLSGWSWW
jgi:hypothetical protein